MWFVLRTTMEISACILCVSSWYLNVLCIPICTGNILILNKSNQEKLSFPLTLPCDSPSTTSFKETYTSRFNKI